MAYLAHSKRARVESYDNGDHNQAVIDHKEQLLLRVRELYLNRDFADIEFTIGSDVVPGMTSMLFGLPLQFSQTSMSRHQMQNIGCHRCLV